MVLYIERISKLANPAHAASRLSQPHLVALAAQFGVDSRDLTDRSCVPALLRASQGTAFARKASPAYPLLSPVQRFQIAVAESALPGSLPSAATVFIEALDEPLMADLLRMGYLLVDVSCVAAGEQFAGLGMAKTMGVALDYHAPWLVWQEGSTYFYPTPKTCPGIFSALLSLAERHRTVFDGQRPQVTIHMTGDPAAWTDWVQNMRLHADVLVENAFVMRSDVVQGGRRISAPFEYFQWSDFHSPQEFIAWMRDVDLRQVCFDQAHAFGGWRFENDGIFDPIGDLRFLEMLIDEGFEIGRMHRTSVPRHLAGESRGERTLSALDSHAGLVAFSRSFFLDAYPTYAAEINRIFDKLARRYPHGVNITYEIWPDAAAACAPADFVTDFS
jgi:hypothetical protein